MKKYLLLAMLLIPALSWAQSEWEIPDFEKKQSVEDTKGESTRKAKKTILPRYNVGAVPEIDGKVEWEETFSVPNTDAETLYNRTLEAISLLIKGKQQTERSRISAVNRQEKIIAANMEEEMVFATSSFAKDFTHFRYSIIAECKDNAVNVKLCRMTYKYDVGRPEEESYTAEELITDKQAINKKGTKMFRLNGKFRMKTIDRKDELFSFFKSRITSPAE